jgi:hypothetical protein
MEIGNWMFHVADKLRREGCKKADISEQHTKEET